MDGEGGREKGERERREREGNRELTVFRWKHAKWVLHFPPTQLMQFISFSSLSLSLSLSNRTLSNSILPITMKGWREERMKVNECLNVNPSEQNHRKLLNGNKVTLSSSQERRQGRMESSWNENKILFNQNERQKDRIGGIRNPIKCQEFLPFLSRMVISPSRLSRLLYHALSLWESLFLSLWIHFGNSKLECEEQWVKILKEYSKEQTRFLLVPNWKTNWTFSCHPLETQNLSSWINSERMNLK